MYVGRGKTMDVEKKKTDNMTYSRYGSTAAEQSSGSGSQSKSGPSKKGAGSYRYSSTEDR